MKKKAETSNLQNQSRAAANNTSQLINDGQSEAYIVDNRSETKSLENLQSRMNNTGKISKSTNMLMGQASGNYPDLKQLKVLDKQVWSRMLNSKKRFNNWDAVFSLWGKYLDKQKLLELAKAEELGLILPPKIGHGSGSAGDADSHVQDAADSYIHYQLKPVWQGLSKEEQKEIKNAAAARRR